MWRAPFSVSAALVCCRRAAEQGNTCLAQRYDTAQGCLHEGAARACTSNKIPFGRDRQHGHTLMRQATLIAAARTPALAADHPCIRSRDNCFGTTTRNVYLNLAVSRCNTLIGASQSLLNELYLTTCITTTMTTPCYAAFTALPSAGNQPSLQRLRRNMRHALTLLGRHRL